MQRSTTGTKSRPPAYAIGVSTPPSRPGQTETGRRGSGPRSFRWTPTVVCQSRSCVGRSQAITSPALPAPKTTRLPAAARAEDRRQLEVVVADVVRRHLVVPERARPLRAVEGEQRVGVERRPGVGARRSGARGCRRRGTGSRCPSRRSRRRRSACTRRRRRRPRSGTATALDRREPPAHRPGRGVERVEGAAAVGRKADRARVDDAVRDLRRDVDEPRRSA